MPSPLNRAWNFLYYRLVHAPRGGGKPVPVEAIDEEYRSGNWDHFFGSEELARHKILLELIYSRPPTPKLLDLGCGSGRLALMLDPTRISGYLGVDISEEGLRRARSLNLAHGRFEQGDFETWRPKESFDVITFNECLGYARVPAETATALARHLTPDGVLIISMFRWGNHAAIWKSIESHFTVITARIATNNKNQIWDLKVLRLRS